MADVRSMLRAERAARRITHPHAAYTSDGKLLCNLCDTAVKGEAQWQSHLHSTQHSLRSQRAQDAAAARATSMNRASTKKRKAEAMDASLSPQDDRKKARAQTVQGSDEMEEHERTQVNDGQSPSVAMRSPLPKSMTAGSTPASATDPTSNLPDDRMDDEFAAFEREVAALDQLESRENNSSNPALAVLNAEATVSAAPVTAEELAAKAREEQSVQRDKREAEYEADKEDAARQLEEEFEAMDNLEERLRKLRERREALRKQETSPVTVLRVGAEDGSTAMVDNDDASGEEDSDGDDYEDNMWNFGGS